MRKKRHILVHILSSGFELRFLARGLLSLLQKVKTRLLLFAGTAALATFAQAQPAQMPVSWPEWESSQTKGDKAIVDRIKKTDPRSNCVAWGQSSRKKLKTRAFWAVQEYLLYHNAINGNDIGGVNDRVPTIKMSTCGVYGVLGLPDDVNRTDRANGRRTQYVYRDKGVYVYTEGPAADWNAQVTAVQH